MFLVPKESIWFEIERSRINVNLGGFVLFFSNWVQQVEEFESCAKMHMEILSTLTYLL